MLITRSEIKEKISEPTGDESAVIPNIVDMMAEIRPLHSRWDVRGTNECGSLDRPRLTDLPDRG